jgi:hypothetical protein
MSLVPALALPEAEEDVAESEPKRSALWLLRPMETLLRLELDTDDEDIFDDDDDKDDDEDSFDDESCDA